MLTTSFISERTREIISGARYSGVPHNVHVRPLTRLAKPKSNLQLQTFPRNNECLIFLILTMIFKFTTMKESSCKLYKNYTDDYGK
uniref:Uncharacterized protein n=1 Tax=Romanomermis culicivorax TaxID=13658 RepID=A0A915IQP8_ROMCU